MYGARSILVEYSRNLHEMTPCRSAKWRESTHLCASADLRPNLQLDRTTALIRRCNSTGR